MPRVYIKKMEENKKDTAKLLSVFFDRHTALHLFGQCTLHKLPHLLGSEVMYCFHETGYRDGILSIGIGNMVNDFLAKLMFRDSIPPDSLLIAYIAITQGELGLMNAHTRAVLDFVLTMRQDTR